MKATKYSIFKLFTKEHSEKQSTFVESNQHICFNENGEESQENSPLLDSECETSPQNTPNSKFRRSSFTEFFSVIIDSEHFQQQNHLPYSKQMVPPVPLQELSSKLRPCSGPRPLGPYPRLPRKARIPVDPDAFNI